jgi:Zn-dependent protease
MGLPLLDPTAEAFAPPRTHVSVRPRGRAGARIRVDISCVLGMALATWSVADVLALTFQGRPSAVYWAAGAAAALLMVASLGLHETAHCVAAARVGIAIRQVELSLFGGLTSLAREPDTPGAALRITLAGPLASLGLAATAAATHVVLVEVGADDVTAAVAAIVAVGNLAIGLLNLVPVLPLDAGHAACAALTRWGWSNSEAERWVVSAGGILGAGLLVLALVASAAGDSMIALWSGLFGFVLAQHAGGLERGD